MVQVDRDQAQAPAAPHTNNDGASTVSSADESMEGLLDMVTELKGDIGARLTSLEAWRFEDDQASVVSAGRSTFRAYAKTCAGLGRNITISSLEDELIRSSARHNSVGQGHQQLREKGGRKEAPMKPPTCPSYRPVPAPSYCKTPLQIRNRKLAIENFDGSEVYPGLGSGHGLRGKRFLRQVKIAEDLSGCMWTEEIKLDILGRHPSSRAG